MSAGSESWLRVRPRDIDRDGLILEVTPRSAGWGHVGFAVLRLSSGKGFSGETGLREACLVVIEGSCSVATSDGHWPEVGSRPTPFDGPPDAVYLPPGSQYEVAAGSDGVEVGVCTAPARVGEMPRLLKGDEIVAEMRGSGNHERLVRPILMEGEAAESLLVCEVLTPPGHWSSYPPHRHERDDMPKESLLEETYYHRISPAHGFGLQWVYNDARTLDETVAFRDRDVVLVPSGYHTVSAPPGYAVYYLNVMAGPSRSWAIVDDPDHAWIKAGGS